MTTWTPGAAVSVAGTDYTDETVVGATITLGRPDVYQQPQPGYARVSLITTVDAAKPIQVTDPIRVTLNSPTLGAVPVFTGTVSDVTTTVEDAGPSGIRTRIDLLAVGPLALLNRRNANATGYPQEGDGTRVARILDEVYATSWDEVPATTDWLDEPATLTWAEYDTVIGNVDQPGVYTVTADNRGSRNAYQQAAEAAKSGLGVLYEAADGTINYDDADHRQDNASLNGYITLPQGAIGSQGLTTTARFGTIVNTLTLTYGGNASITVEDQPSITAYGPLAATITTDLVGLVDATEQATRYLTLWAQPRPALSRIGVPVHSPAIGDTLRDQLLRIYNGAPVNIPTLPAVLGGAFLGFVEGWTWRIGRATADLDLTISDLQSSVVATKWVNVVPTETWSTLEPTLTWEEALVVA